MNLIRGSEISSFLKCRKQWQYAWYENIVPKRPDNKVFFGTLIHKFLEVYYTSLSTEEALEAMQHLFVNTDTSGMQQFEIDDLWDLVVKVSEHYVKQWQDKNAKRSVIATELRFAVQLYREYYYEGTIDLLYEEDGRLYFSDYKNTSSIDRYLSMAKMDRQISRYWWALQQLARGNGLIWYAPDDKWIPVDIWENMTVEGRKLKEPTGFVYDIILRDYPVTPEILKKGGLSVAKNQKTTREIYWKTLEKNGLLITEDEGQPCEAYAPQHYHEILDHLSKQESDFGNRFFHRLPVIKNENEIQSAMREFVSVLKDREHIRKTLQTPADPTDVYNPCYRNITADCSWCSYQSLCLVELDGGNVELTKNIAYTKKEM